MRNKGFTIVELLVSTSIFVVVLSVAVVTFMQTLRTQQTVTELTAANNNANQTLEQMGREIRTGQLFSTSPDGSLLTFTNANGKKISYTLIHHPQVGDSREYSDINRCLVDTLLIPPHTCVLDPNNPNVDVGFRPMTASEVTVDRLQFYLQLPTSTLATRVTATLSLTGPKDIKVNLQSTFSPRLTQ